MESCKSEALVGKTILVGITYQTSGGQIDDQAQLFGTIRSVEPKGQQYEVQVETLEGERVALPLFYRTLMHAPRGDYRLLSSGEVVQNPDYLMCWAVRMAGSQGGAVWKPVYAPFHNQSIPVGWDMQVVKRDVEYIEQLLQLHGEDYIGKQVMLGIVMFEKDGERQRMTGRQQYHGKIIRIDLEDGVVIDVGEGKEYMLPPDVSWLEPAEPAQYQITTTGETVTNPDFLVMWSVMQTKPEEI